MKNTKVDMCRYGPDGKVQKTPVVEPPPPEKKRGMKGKIDREQDRGDEGGARGSGGARPAIPPTLPRHDAGGDECRHRVDLQAGPGRASLKFPGYAKVNDALTLTFDSTVKALQQIDVQTWLDEPDNAVTLKVTMNGLPDGVSHPGAVVLGMPKRKIEVRITKSNYQKLAQ